MTTTTTRMGTTSHPRFCVCLECVGRWAQRVSVSKHPGVWRVGKSVSHPGKFMLAHSDAFGGYSTFTDKGYVANYAFPPWEADSFGREIKQSVAYAIARKWGYPEC